MARTTDYVELRCRSAFSFLTGASLPEDLAERAAALTRRLRSLQEEHGYPLDEGHRRRRQLEGAASRLGLTPEQPLLI